MPIPSSSPSATPLQAPKVEAPPAEPEQFAPLAAFAAWLLPGAGHYLHGQTRRAALIAIGILGTTIMGLLIGGIDSVDRREDSIWFAGQVLVGPIVIGVDHINQTYGKVRDRVNERTRAGVRPVDKFRTPRPDEVRDPATGQARAARPDEKPFISKSIGRMNELGTLFIAVAGMLNLIAIIDAGMHAPRRS
ncbi:MAG: DUF6677 family protein [Phycisphaerales bacterium]